MMVFQYNIKHMRIVITAGTCSIFQVKNFGFVFHQITYEKGKIYYNHAPNTNK